MNMELEVIPKRSTELIWLQSESRRDRRQRERRSRRKFGRLVAVCFAGTFGVGTLVFTVVNQPPGKAEAAETTIAPTVAPRPVTPPQVVTPTTGAGWTKVQVHMPGQDPTLGKLITDGNHAQRVLPGQLGVSVITVETDPPANAATVNVEGKSWRIFHRGKTPANDLSPLIHDPDVPVVVLISEVPGDMRTYIEAVQA